MILLCDVSKFSDQNFENCGDEEACLTVLARESTDWGLSPCLDLSQISKFPVWACEQDRPRAIITSSTQGSHLPPLSVWLSAFTVRLTAEMGEQAGVARKELFGWRDVASWVDEASRWRPGLR